MKVAIFQANTIDNCIKENLKRYTQALERLDKDAELLVMPEMFTTGFTTDTKYAQTKEEEGFSWMKETALKYEIAISGSLFIKDGDSFFNRHFFVFPNGEYDYYDKKHLFCLSKEPTVITAGGQKRIIKYKDWNIRLLTCYDLRFPIWCRNTYINNVYEYDLSIYIASWPEIRKHAWNSLLVARAIENISYIIGVNRCGIDKHKLNYSGDSVILNFKGEILKQAYINKEEIVYHHLDKQSLIEFRQSFPIGKDWD